MKDKEIDAKKQIYEVGYHLMPTVSESEISKLVVRIRTIIEEKRGNIISEEMPKEQTIAYEIAANTSSKKQKFDKSCFGWIKFEADNSSVSGIKKALEEVAEIMRFILIKTVRENTIFYPKFQRPKRENERNDKVEISAEVKEVSEEEIDKGIEQLVLN